MARSILVKDVKAHIEECAKIVGIFEQAYHHSGMVVTCEEIIDSPIEQLLFSALSTLRHINRLTIDVNPQVQIGKYRVDFLLTYHHPENGTKTELVVECDSQQFHERSEPERRYEKARDRFLITNGYKAFHFTGTEIKANPFKVAMEILSHLTGLELCRV